MEPILKWAGGKRQLLSELKKYITKELIGENRYYEPFIGAGSLAFSLECHRLTINDYNEELINVYNVVKSNPIELIKELEKHQKYHSHDYYYEVRALDRDCSGYSKLSNVKKAARMIYLNKTCYNGLYRVNSQGFYNVPIGKNTQQQTPNIVMKERIIALHNYLNNSEIEIRKGDFAKSVFDAKAGDVIYFDPPYDYEKEGFKSYVKTGFTHDDLVRLRNLCNELIERGCIVVISNNDTQFVRECFNADCYVIHSIEAKRYINCKGDRRTKAQEVIIYGQK